MRTLFSNEVFVHRPFGAPGLAQAGVPQAAFALQDYLDRIQGIADEEKRAELKAKFEECKAKGLDTAEGLGCLAILGADIAAALREEETPAPTPGPALPPAPRPGEGGGFPIVPVAVGGLLAAGLVVFLATRK